MDPMRTGLSHIQLKFLENFTLNRKFRQYDSVFARLISGASDTFLDHSRFPFPSFSSGSNIFFIIFSS